MSDPALRIPWHSLQRPDHSALITYLRAGYSDRATSIAAMRLAARHADILEVGVPLSAPVADGPVIQRASFDVLAGGMSLRGTPDAAGLEAEVGRGRAIAPFADGVVVGSALVDALGRGGLVALKALLAELGPACVRPATAGAYHD